jgi:dimethylargininase
VTTTAALKSPFVWSDADALRSVFLHAPTEAIAQVMPVQGESHAIADRAADQFKIFAARLASFGVHVLEASSPGDAPLGYSCADGAVIFEDGAFLMRPSDPRLRGAIASLEDSLTSAGIPTIGRIEAPGLLDAGDVLLAGETIYIGVPVTRRAETGMTPSLHGNALGREQLRAFARGKNRRVVDVAMAAEVPRLRTAASLVDTLTVLCSPGLLDVAAFEGLEKIEVARGEDYAAGVLVLGKRRVITNLRFRETIPQLRKAKIAVEAIDLWEFGKIGVTPSALALALKRG